MTAILDLESFEGIAARPTRRRAPVNTNPLKLEGAERKAIDQVAAEIDRNLRIKSLSSYDQMTAFHAAIQCIEACLAGDWKALSASAQTGLEAALRVQNVSPYLICKQDEAKRNLASDQRAELQKMAMRLGHAAPAASRLDEDRARCLRAATYAAIAADRGLLHIVKENLGCIIKVMHDDEFPARGRIAWTQSLIDLARRYRSAGVRVP
jgi:hypothetical protein